MNTTFREFLALSLVGFGVFCFFKGLPSSVTHDSANGVMPGAVAAVYSQPPAVPAAGMVKSRAIQEIKVGQRVLANNPEISNLERRTRGPEPNFDRWLQLSLELPKSDGSTLHIEMLRSEEWLRNQIGFVIGEVPDPSGERLGVSPPCTTAIATPDLNLPSPKTENLQPKTPPAIGHSGLDIGHCLFSPLRPIFHDIALASVAAEAESAELVGLTVDLELPEMGACGTAIITGISTSPEIERGEGQVVTATFRHPPSNTVLDVVFVDEGTSLDPHGLATAETTVDPEANADIAAAESTRSDTASKPIGVTDNHLFWSEDRDEFIEIGHMEIGERVRTLFGETKILAQKLPRPGPPAEVYNLEVHEEHVYFVGNDGVLAHNTCDAASRRAYLNAKFGRTGNLDVDISARGLTSAVNSDQSILKSIRRHSERLVAGRAVPGSVQTALRVSAIRSAVRSDNLKLAGTHFHELNFRFADMADNAGGFSGSILIDKPFETLRGSFGRPDFRFGMQTLDIKPWRSSGTAYATTDQFTRYQTGAGGIPTIPLYYRLRLP